jgi:hypothetical protein
MQVDSTVKKVSKTIWTETNLQKEKKALFELFKTCGRDKNGVTGCNDCTNRKCENITRKMGALLTPYSESIYKRAFKHRSTLEEMGRVVTESVNAVIMDVWELRKDIHTSFGSMVKWKMIYYLDGRMNLYDIKVPRTEDARFQSIDQMLANLEGAGSNFSGRDVIEYMNDAFVDMKTSISDYRDIIRTDTVATVKSILEGSELFYCRYSSNKVKFSSIMRTVVGIRRFIQKRSNYKLFEDQPLPKYYYMRLLDVIMVYLEEYRVMK